MAYVIGDNCVNCGTCADACPLGIISEGDGKYVIDADQCVECGTSLLSARTTNHAGIRSKDKGPVLFCTGPRFLLGVVISAGSCMIDTSFCGRRAWRNKSAANTGWNFRRRSFPSAPIPSRWRILPVCFRARACATSAAAAGALGLLLLAKCETLQVTGVEIQEPAARCAGRKCRPKRAFPVFCAAWRSARIPHAAAGKRV